MVRYGLTGEDPVGQVCCAREAGVEVEVSCGEAVEQSGPDFVTAFVVRGRISNAQVPCGTLYPVLASSAWLLLV